MWGGARKRIFHVICWHGEVSDSLMTRAKAVKEAESLFPLRTCQGPGVGLGCEARMLLLCLLKNGGVITLLMHPQRKDDADPHSGQCSHRYRVAFALRSFALIVGSGPRFTRQSLPGELLQGIAQRFDTAEPTMRFAVASTLIQHGGGAGQLLQTRGVLIALSMITNFGRASEVPGACQHVASWQRSDGLHGSKKGCESPCHPVQCVPEGAAADSPTPASSAIWCG